MDYTDQCSFYGDSLSKAHKAQGSPSPCFDLKQEGEDAENERFEGEKLRKEVPYFPDELYDRLPNLTWPLAFLPHASGAGEDVRRIQFIGIDGGGG